MFFFEPSFELVSAHVDQVVEISIEWKGPGVGGVDPRGGLGRDALSD